MAFPTGWTRSCKLTIQHGQVSANQTAFPVLITEATLPSEILVSGGANAAQSDGGDIRFSSDSAGVTQLACEIVVWDQSGGKAEIWVPVSILTASDVDIYVWYKAGGGLSQPAVGAAFGAQAVWDTNYKLVQHGGVLSMLDSTSNGNDGTAHGNTGTIPSTVAGKIGNATHSAASSGQYIDYGSASDLRITGALTLEAWFKIGVYSNQTTIAAKGFNGSKTGYTLTLGNSASPFQNHLVFLSYDGAIHGAYTTTTFSSSNVGTWYHGTGVWTGSAWKIYLNGADETNVSNGATGPQDSTTAKFTSNTEDGGTSNQFGGDVDEVRVSSIARSADWILTQYRMTNSPSTFVVAGTPGGGAGGGVVIAAFMHSYRKRRI